MRVSWSRASFIRVHPSWKRVEWREREREKKDRNQAQTRKNHSVGLVTRARKTRGGGVEDLVNTGKKKKGTMALQSHETMLATSDALFRVTLACFHPMVTRITTL